MTLLEVFGIVVTVVTFLSPLHQPIKQLCQPVLWKLIPRQLQPVEWAQRFQHPLLEWAVLLSALTVTVEFYVAGLAILVWCGWQHQVAVLLGVLGLAGHVVFRVKDLLEGPRPADCIKAATQKLNITVKDHSGDIEDGIPSAHCCGSVILLYYTINAAADHIPNSAQPYAQLGAAAWVLWIAYGRLYLGVHSPVDLVAGAVVGWSLLALWQQLEHHYIIWVLTSQHLQWQTLLAGFVLLRSYPMPSRYTDTINYTVAWIGGWAGVMLGYRQTYPAVLTEEAAGMKLMFSWSSAAASSPFAAHCHPNSSTTVARCPCNSQQQVLLAGFVPLLAVKVLLGLCLTVITKIVARRVCELILEHAFGLVPISIRCLWQPPVVGVDIARLAENNAEICMSKWTKKEKKLKEQESCTCTRTPAGVLLRFRQHGLSALRQAPNGRPYDVVITAKFCSYVAVGYMICTLDLWWNPLVMRMAYTSSIA